MPIVVAYSRVSSTRQVEEGVSLAAQAAKIANWCKQNGHEPPIFEADEGISGKKTNNRPALQRALDRVCAEKGILVTYSLSRLCRSTRDALDIAERIKKAGANLVSLTESLDTQSPTGEFFFTVMAALAQLERRMIGERTREALAHKRRNGEKTGGDIPYGYRHVEGQLVEDSTEQTVIQRMLQGCKGGKNYSLTASELNRDSIPTRRCGRWSAKTVRAIYLRTSRE